MVYPLILLHEVLLVCKILRLILTADEVVKKYM